MVLIYIHMIVSVYWSMCVLCVIACVCLISNQSTNKKPCHLCQTSVSLTPNVAYNTQHGGGMGDLDKIWKRGLGNIGGWGSGGVSRHKIGELGTLWKLWFLFLGSFWAPFSRSTLWWSLLLNITFFFFHFSDNPRQNIYGKTTYFLLP